ncbi:hypothetical protein [Kiloniella antarctica]|uniref:Uncharacterized protein n=1 Tax=Kiloniella antarctica TaxID=1550907 RepID=A0ABW5BME6_9PROT
MSHQPMLRLAQLLNRIPCSMCRHMIRNVFAAGFEILQRKHGRADDLGRSTDAVGVVSHGGRPVVVRCLQTFTTVNLKSFELSRGKFNALPC